MTKVSVFWLDPNASIADVRTPTIAKPVKNDEEMIQHRLPHTTFHPHPNHPNLRVGLVTLPTPTKLEPDVFAAILRRHSLQIHIIGGN